MQKNAHCKCHAIIYCITFTFSVVAGGGGVNFN